MPNRPIFIPALQPPLQPAITYYVPEPAPINPDFAPLAINPADLTPADPSVPLSPDKPL